MVHSVDKLSLILFVISAAAILTITILGLFFAAPDRVQFWPPPAKKTWQHRCFLILFRLFLYPLVALSILRFEFQPGTAGLVRYLLGGTLFTAGFGLALWITLQLGWRNAFGEKLGLMTSSWFAWSRNPIYVVTWLGLLGWAIILNDTNVSILLGGWAMLYILAPFLEEPWLVSQYGDSYSQYRKNVRRFF